MEILLIENVTALGARGDVVNVKDGYARNFLLPRKMALPVTAGNKRQIELEKVRAEKVRAKELADAKSLGCNLNQYCRLSAFCARFCNRIFCRRSPLCLICTKPCLELL